MTYLTIFVMFSIDCQVENSENKDEPYENDFISYIVDCLKLFEAEMINANTMVSNLSAAIVFQFLVMEILGVEFRKESAARLNNTEACSMIQKLTSTLCVDYYGGMKIVIII